MTYALPMNTYFIGYDAREDEAAKVAAYSIQCRANSQSRIYILEHRTLRRLGLFKRSWNIDAKGQFHDLEDERPFSTEFSHSRFLVFHLANALKITGPCMFLDCDWLFTDDPGHIMRKQTHQTYKIGVVNRERKVDEGSTKMDGMSQHNYTRKLWSALFTFNPSETLAIHFSPGEVSAKSGRDLHSFLGRPSEKFWEIDPDWHYIPSLDEPPSDTARGIHFSEFSPWLNPDRYADSPKEFDLWTEERHRWLEHAARTRGELPWRNLELDLIAAGA